jgi:4-aminobutyrate aminotransferase/(S)-3-amino-2-methylpropionate transaminase
MMDSVHVGGLGGTYGGNPIACAAALGAIETMRTLDLASRARHIESVMRPRLEKLPGILEARGRGAMLAVELGDAARTSALSKACHERGLLTLTCGTFGTVFRFLPPLVISDDELARGLDILEEVFHGRLADT